MKYMWAVKPGEENQHGYISECGMFSIKRAKTTFQCGWVWELRDYAGKIISSHRNRHELAQQNGFVIT